VGLLLFLALWQLGSLRYNPVVLPSPPETARALMDLALEGELAGAVLRTTARALGGFALAAAGGMLLGVLAGLQATVGAGLWPVVTVLQGIPPIAWIVLALLWFGGGGGASTFTVAVVTLPFTFVGAVEGVRAADRGLLEMARAFRAPPGVVLWDLYLPQLISYLFPTLVGGLAVAWKVAVMAEVLGADSGIGAGLAVARVNLDTSRAMAWVVVVVALLFAFEHLALHPVKRRLEPWRLDRARPGGAGRSAKSEEVG
jgi:NitT/TauT family transport system permease protein